MALFLGYSPPEIIDEFLHFSFILSRLKKNVERLGHAFGHEKRIGRSAHTVSLPNGRDLPFARRRLRSPELDATGQSDARSPLDRQLPVGPEGRARSDFRGPARLVTVQAVDEVAEIIHREVRSSYATRRGAGRVPVQSIGSWIFAANYSGPKGFLLIRDASCFRPFFSRDLVFMSRSFVLMMARSSAVPAAQTLRSLLNHQGPIRLGIAHDPLD
jgi:hypothetical protein